MIDVRGIKTRIGTRLVAFPAPFLLERYHLAAGADPADRVDVGGAASAAAEEIDEAASRVDLASIVARRRRRRRRRAIDDCDHLVMPPAISLVPRLVELVAADHLAERPAVLVRLADVGDAKFARRERRSARRREALEGIRSHRRGGGGEGRLFRPLLRRRLPLRPRLAVLLDPAPPAVARSAPIALRHDPVPARASPRLNLSGLDQVSVVVRPAESPPPSRRGGFVAVAVAVRVVGGGGPGWDERPALSVLAAPHDEAEEGAVGVLLAHVRNDEVRHEGVYRRHHGRAAARYDHAGVALVRGEGISPPPLLRATPRSSPRWASSSPPHR